MTTSLANVAVSPREMTTPELDLVAAGAGCSARATSFGGMVGFFAGEGLAALASVFTANPLPLIAFQVLAAAGGAVAGCAVTDAGD